MMVNNNGFLDAYADRIVEIVADVDSYKRIAPNNKVLKFYITPQDETVVGGASLAHAVNYSDTTNGAFLSALRGKGTTEIANAAIWLNIKLYFLPKKSNKIAIRIEDVPAVLDMFMKLIRNAPSKAHMLRAAEELKKHWLENVLKQKGATPSKAAPCEREQNLFSDYYNPSPPKFQPEGNTVIEKFLRFRNFYQAEGLTKQQADSMAVELLGKQTGKDYSFLLSAIN